MDYLAFIVFLIVAVVSLISLVIGLPGTFIILAASILYGWYGGFEEITVKVIIVLIVLAVLGEVLEFALGIAGAKKEKASKGAIVGSIVGGIVGAIWGAAFLFGIGAVVGAFVGAFAGAFAVEFLRGRGVDQSIQSGRGAFIGRIFGTVTKGIIGVTMIAIAVVAVTN